MTRILCIDNDPYTARWVCNGLRAAGIECDVVSVDTGKKGFNKLAEGGYDLCVLEYALPDMTGVQLCTLMRQYGSSVPMIFFSAMNRPVDRQRAAAARANAYLSKPEDLDIFVPTVQRVLNFPANELGDVIEFAKAA